MPKAKKCYCHENLHIVYSTHSLKAIKLYQINMLIFMINSRHFSFKNSIILDRYIDFYCIFDICPFLQEFQQGFLLLQITKIHTDIWPAF